MSHSIIISFTKYLNLFFGMLYEQCYTNDVEIVVILTTFSILVLNFIKIIPAKLHFLFDLILTTIAFFAVLLPVTLNMAIFLLILNIVLFSFFFFFFPVADEQASEKQIITVFRTHINFFIFFTIVAIDFPIFPADHKKTKYQEFALMDLGVGAIIGVSGYISNNSTKPKQFLHYFLILLMGILRTAFVLISGYPTSVYEYGNYMNFFFVIFMVKMITLVIDPKGWMSGVLGIGIMILHETVLNKFNLYHYVKYAKRKGFFGCNREGLICVVGYVSVYFIGKFTAFIMQKSKSNIQKAKIAHIMFIASYILLKISLNFRLSSRLMVNISYILGLSCVLYNGIAIIFWLAHKGIIVTKSSIGCSYNQLFLFLLSNLMVGLNNIMIKPQETSKSLTKTFMILLIYLTILRVICHILGNKNVKIDLLSLKAKKIKEE